jgi:hypothetical protein
MLGLLASALLTGPLLTSDAAAHGNGTNGCTAVPNSGLGFDFHGSCDGHDLCYQNYWYGRSDQGRSACDVWFYNSMAAHCRNAQPWWWRPTCYSQAEIYYRGVRLFGSKWFWHSDKLSRANTPMYG